MTVIAEQNQVRHGIRAARDKAVLLWDEVKAQELIQPGITELDLNNAIYQLARDHFNIHTFWHKRIVRSGINTLSPYKENPPNLVIQEDDILFFDFGPVFEAYEADIGRAFVLGSNPEKQRLVTDLSRCFDQLRTNYLAQPQMTGQTLYSLFEKTAAESGWQVSLQGHCGHLIGAFPHERIVGEDSINYICPQNTQSMALPDQHGKPRHWILEIHLVSPDNTFGGFYEDLLDL